MNRVTRGSVMLAGVLSAISCSGDPTSSLRNGIDHLVATPSALYVLNNSTKLVTVSAVDAQGNTIASSFSLSSVGAGITVVNDSTFDPVYNNNGQLVQPSVRTSARFIVTPTQYDSTHFTVTAGGKSLIIPVRVAPATLTTPLSKASALYGDTITVAAPTGLEFDTLNSLVLVGADTATITSISPTSVSFVPGLKAASGKPTVTNVSLLYAPAAGTFTVPTDQTLTLPSVPVLTLNKTNANVGDTILVTAPGALRFTAASVPSVGGTGLAFLGVVDSTHLRFLIGPGATDSVSVSNVIISGVPGKSYTATSGAAKLTSTPITPLAVTYSTSTPNTNDPVTVTAPAGIKFLPNVKVFIGTDQQLVTSVAADSNSFVFRAFRSPGGTLKIQNVAFAALTSVSFGAPSTTGVTIGATVTQLAGTASAATAPQVQIADPGFSSGVVDATPAFGIDLSGLCGGPCGGRAYKIVVAPGRTVDVTLNWNSDDDLGGYLASSPAGSLLSTSTFPPADNFGPGPTGHPEKSTWTLPAGTYTILVIDFEAAASPTQISITLTTH